MIVQAKETKTQTSLIELLGGSQKKNDTKNSDTFSKLLMSLAEGAKTDKSIVKTDLSKTFNAVIDPKKAQEKASLQQLLSGDDQPQNTNLFQKSLLDTLSSDQVRAMINRAKEYLKNEITSKAPEYKTDPKSLPKTLMGLVQLADKMGLNPQSITLSTLFTEPADQAKFTPALLSQPLLDTKSLNSASAAKTLSSPTFEAIAQLLNEVKTKESAPKTESKNDVSKKEAEHKQPLSALLQTLTKAPEAPSSALSASDVPLKPAEPKTTVSAKTEGLITLLQGESKKEEESKSAPSSKTDMDASKTHQAPKADALEVKTKEAAQSMRYFASDLKEAVDSYKPPFTRLSMTLNPEKLGEVEVTLIQRGNNVHVNIQSNNTNSVAFLAHNATELKTQLANQGITNTTMNFMSGGDGQNQNPGQQQQQQQQNRFRAYESLKEMDLNGEQLSALEIIIPHYA